MIIPLETLSLVTFDKNNKEHVIFLKKIIKDQTIKSRFNGFLSRLNSKANYGIIDKGFFLSKDSELIGFVDIGSFNEVDLLIY